MLSLSPYGPFGTVTGSVWANATNGEAARAATASRVGKRDFIVEILGIEVRERRVSSPRATAQCP
jgi:hypothetical protein